MSQFLPLYFETRSKKLVFSSTDATEVVLPEFHQEDTITLELYAQTRIAQWDGQLFERILLSGFSGYVAVGSANNVLASQNSFTSTDDGYGLIGNLNLNTAGINALADGASSTFEIRLFNGTSYYRGQYAVTIRKSVALAAAIVTVPGDTALGALEAQRTYVRRIGAAGEGQEFTSPDGTKKVYMYLDNDGTMRYEPIT
jgi:hypothetical protein